MEPFAIVALQFVNDEARSALPDAPVVPDRPSLLGRVADAFAAARLTLGARELRGRAALARADVRRAA